MKVFEAIYSMGGIATGGFFKSLVAALKQANVKGLLNEQHGEDVFSLWVEEYDMDASVYPYEQVINTDFA